MAQVTSIASVPFDVTYSMHANASLATQTIFGPANRAYNVISMSETHGTLATNGGAVTIDIFKDTSTNAPGGGATAITAGSVSAGNNFNAKATINTPQSGTSTTTLAIGDRLSVVFTGTLTALADVNVSVLLQPA